MLRKAVYVAALGLLTSLAAAQQQKPELPAASPNQTGNSTTNPEQPPVPGSQPTAPPQDPTAVTSPKPAPPATTNADPVNAQAKGGDKAATTSESVGSLNTDGVTSAQLQQKIEAALRSEPTLSGSNLTVVVKDDEIDLSGNVSSGKERTTASRIAQSFGENRKLKDTVQVSGASKTTSVPTEEKK